MHTQCGENLKEDFLAATGKAERQWNWEKALKNKLNKFTINAARKLIQNNSTIQEVLPRDTIEN